MSATVWNCGMMKPHLGRILTPHLATSPCLCLLVETGSSLLLVDTGLGMRDVADPRRLGSSNIILNAQRDPENTAIRKLEAAGFAASDVTDIVCTHLDRDHAGGLSDFPHARVHVHLAERNAALDPPTRRERERYRECHFAHGPVWVTHEDLSDKPWFGMDCIRGMEGLPPEIVMVPLPGHTRGHMGVAVKTGEGWLLHCGDTFYVSRELAVDRKAPVDVRAFRRLAHVDHRLARLALIRVRRLAHVTNGRVTMFSSHDFASREELEGRRFG